MKVKVKVKSCLTLRPHGLQPTRLLCPWDFPGKNSLQVYLLHGMRDLGSLTRDQAHIPFIAERILNTWTTKEVPTFSLPMNLKNKTESCSLAYLTEER